MVNNADPTPKPQDENRVSIINSIKSPLGLFTLLLLVIEAITLGIAATSNQVALYFSLGILALYIIGIFYFAKTNPAILFGHYLPPVPKPIIEISGDWWEIVVGAYSSAISFARISYDQANQNVMISAQSFLKNGQILSTWSSQAVQFKESGDELFYLWEGSHLSEPENQQVGSGYIKFKKDVDTQKLNTGLGYYTDIILKQPEKTKMKSVFFEKSNLEESRIMQKPKSPEAVKLIAKKLEESVVKTR
jgi:hypothetical protein